MNARRDYCWRFGEHKDDPCPCGWASDRHKASEIRQFLKRQQDNIAQAVRETASYDVHMIRYLQGMNDAFCRVTLFLDTKENKRDAGPLIIRAIETGDPPLWRVEEELDRRENEAR